MPSLLLVDYTCGKLDSSGIFRGLQIPPWGGQERYRYLGPRPGVVKDAIATPDLPLGALLEKSRSSLGALLNLRAL